MKKPLKLLAQLLLLCVFQNTNATDFVEYRIDEVEMNIAGTLIVSGNLYSGDEIVYGANPFPDQTRKFKVDGLGESFIADYKTSSYKLFFLDVSKKIKAIKKPSNDQTIIVQCLNCEVGTHINNDPPTAIMRIDMKAYLKDFAEEQQKRQQHAKNEAMQAKQKEADLVAEKRAAAAKAAKIAKEGDGSLDDRKCQSYGMKPGTSTYGNCRFQLDLVRRQENAAFDAEERQRAAQKELIDVQNRQARRQAEENEKSERRRNAAAMIGAGAALLGGPQIPSQQPNVTKTETIRLPSGRIMNCTTTGSITNCF